MSTDSIRISVVGTGRMGFFHTRLLHRLGFLDSIVEPDLEKASKIAGVSISKMLDIFREYGVRANLEYEDYLKGLKTLRKVW